MLIIFPPVCHLRLNFAYGGFFLTHKKVLFLSNRIHQSFPLLFSLEERPANLSMFKKAQITQVYKASFQTYLRKKSLEFLYMQTTMYLGHTHLRLPPPSPPSPSTSPSQSHVYFLSLFPLSLPPFLFLITR